MTDSSTPTNGHTSHSPVTEPSPSDNGHPTQTTLLQSDNRNDGVRGTGDRWWRRYGMPLFTANASCVIWLWMVGIVYGNSVVRTLERRFGLRSTQTGVMMTSGDIVHMCIVLFVGYFGRRGHKPRFMSVTAIFSGVGYFLMALPHWLYNSQGAALSAFNNDCTSCIHRQHSLVGNNLQLNGQNNNPSPPLFALFRPFTYSGSNITNASLATLYHMSSPCFLHPILITDC